MRAARTVCLVAGLCVAAPLAAQEKFPYKPIRLLVPFSTGSATDFMARTVGEKMTERWGQPVVIDNRPSAGGVIASEFVVNALPDGHTLMMVSIGHAVNASLYGKLPYDTVKDFAGVTLVADVPNVLVVMPSLGLKSVRDLIDLAKAKPGQLNYASAGVGSGTHMNGEQFKLAAGINAVHIPYKGTPEALSNTMSGSVQFFFAPIVGAIQLVKAGKLTGLGVTTKNRSPIFPTMPTVAESGLPGFDFNLWTGLLASAKTPRPLKETLAREVVRIVELQDVKDKMLTQGATPHTMTPAEFDAFIKAEVERLAKVVKASGAKAE